MTVCLHGEMLMTIYFDYDKANGSVFFLCNNTNDIYLTFFPCD